MFGEIVKTSRGSSHRAIEDCRVIREASSIASLRFVVSSFRFRMTKISRAHSLAFPRRIAEALTDSYYCRRSVDSCYSADIMIACHVSSSCCCYCYCWGSFLRLEDFPGSLSKPDTAQCSRIDAEQLIVQLGSLRFIASLYPRFIVLLCCCSVIPFACFTYRVLFSKAFLTAEIIAEYPSRKINDLSRNVCPFVLYASLHHVYARKTQRAPMSARVA